MCCTTVGGAARDGVDLAAEQGDHRRPGAGERNVDHVEPGRRLQHLHRHVHRAVVARAAVGVRAGLAARVGDEFGKRLPGRLGAHDQHGRIGSEARHRLELLHLVGGLAVEQLVRLRQHRDRRQAEQQRVAVGRRARRDADAGRAARARLVLDDDGLLQLASERFGDRPRDRVRDAAGRERHDHRDRPVGIARLRPDGVRHGKQRDARQGQQQASALQHVRLLRLASIGRSPSCVAGINPVPEAAAIRHNALIAMRRTEPAMTDSCSRCRRQTLRALLGASLLSRRRRRTGAGLSDAARAHRRAVRAGRLGRRLRSLPCAAPAGCARPELRHRQPSRRRFDHRHRRRCEERARRPHAADDVEHAHRQRVADPEQAVPVDARLRAGRAAQQLGSGARRQACACRPTASPS